MTEQKFWYILRAVNEQKFTNKWSTFGYTKSRIEFDSHTKNVWQSIIRNPTNKTDRNKSRDMHAGCVQVQTFGTDWDVWWGSCFFWLFERTYVLNAAADGRKRLLSELTGGRISRWGKDKRVRKREKYHSCVKKRRNRKEGFDGGNDSWDCAVAGDLGGTPNRCKLVWATSINSLLHLSKFLSATLLSIAVATATAHSSALQIKIYPAWISQPIGVVHTGR